MTTMIVKTTGAYTDPKSGQSVPVGSVIFRGAIQAGYTFDMGPNTALMDDDGTAAWHPTVPAPTVISSRAFLDRFTTAEQAAVQQAAASNVQIAVGLTTGLAAAQIDLTAAALKAWMDALVTAGAITATRETEILTP